MWMIKRKAYDRTDTIRNIVLQHFTTGGGKVMTRSKPSSVRVVKPTARGSVGRGGRWNRKEAKTTTTQTQVRTYRNARNELTHNGSLLGQFINIFVEYRLKATFFFGCHVKQRFSGSQEERYQWIHCWGVLYKESTQGITSCANFRHNGTFPQPRPTQTWINIWNIGYCRI